MCDEVIKRIRAAGGDAAPVRISHGEYNTAIAAVIPYFCGREKGNVSLYARGADYHRVVRNILAQSAAGLENKEIYADVSPFDERRLACAAGLGVLGDNGLLITPRWGSFVFIGEIITLSEAPPEPAPLKFCAHCGRCSAACPSPDSCLSALTQKKGALSAGEEELIRRSGSVWGCDICQLACPCNDGAEETAIPEFREGLIKNLSVEDVDGLSSRALERKFPGRAFTWRGSAVLRRNLQINRR